MTLTFVGAEGIGVVVCPPGVSGMAICRNKEEFCGLIAT
jgi:hypothetical protein